MKKNIPYVKVYENGILQNPIKDSFLNNFPNRMQRRQKINSHTNVLSGFRDINFKYWEKQRNRFFLGKVIAK